MSAIQNTVTIEYNQDLGLFLTEKEQYPFSAERIIQMLNGWGKAKKVKIATNHVRINANGAGCVLTQYAVRALSQ